MPAPRSNGLTTLVVAIGATIMRHFLIWGEECLVLAISSSKKCMKVGSSLESGAVVDVMSPWEIKPLRYQSILLMLVFLPLCNPSMCSSSSYRGICMPGAGTRSSKVVWICALFVRRLKSWQVYTSAYLSILDPADVKALGSSSLLPGFSFERHSIDKEYFRCRASLLGL